MLLNTYNTSDTSSVNTSNKTNLGSDMITLFALLWFIVLPLWLFMLDQRHFIRDLHIHIGLLVVPVIAIPIYYRFTITYLK